MSAEEPVKSTWRLYRDMLLAFEAEEKRLMKELGLIREVIKNAQILLDFEMYQRNHPDHPLKRANATDTAIRRVGSRRDS